MSHDTDSLPGSLENDPLPDFLIADTIVSDEDFDVGRAQELLGNIIPADVLQAVQPEQLKMALDLYTLLAWQRSEEIKGNLGLYLTSAIAKARGQNSQEMAVSLEMSREGFDRWYEEIATEVAELIRPEDLIPNIAPFVLSDDFSGEEPTEDPIQPSPEPSGLVSRTLSSREHQLLLQNPPGFELRMEVLNIVITDAERERFERDFPNYRLSSMGDMALRVVTYEEIAGLLAKAEDVRDPAIVSGVVMRESSASTEDKIALQATGLKYVPNQQGTFDLRLELDDPDGILANRREGSLDIVHTVTDRSLPRRAFGSHLVLAATIEGDRAPVRGAAERLQAFLPEDGLVQLSGLRSFPDFYSG